MMRLATNRPAATVLWKDSGTDRILVDGVEVAESDGLHSNITTPLILDDTIYGILQPRGSPRACGRTPGSGSGKPKG